MEQTQMVLSDDEIKLIKSVFDEKLLKAMRAVIFSLEPTQDEKSIVRSAFQQDVVLQLVKKRFLPSITKDTPIGQVNDVWLGAEQMIFAQHRDAIEQAVQYKHDSIIMVREAIERLIDPDLPEIDLTYNPKENLDDPLRINLLTRNQFIRHIEHQLYYLKLVAMNKEETPEEFKKRASANSSK